MGSAPACRIGAVMAVLDRLFAPDSFFSRRFFFLARRFVAGETIEAAIAAVRALNARGMTATLDFLGEDVLQPEAAIQTKGAYLRMLDAIAASSVRSNVSVKLTAMGLLIDEELALRNLLAILDHASRVNPDPFVRIDMEGSALTDATLRVFELAYGQRPNVGPVLQAYLRRTEGDVERAIALRARVRLCKGAYSEPAEIAYKDMPQIRDSYLRSARMLLDAGHYPGMATHDPGLIESIKAFAADRGIDRESFEFQMLYGVRPTLQQQLIAQGYRLRVYVPFGRHWAGYFYRRVAERKENAVFALSSIFSR